MHRLQLVPSHNESAGKTFPLTLGRCELAKWWWRSCPCAHRVRITRQPCENCKLLASSVKSLSKKMLCISDRGSMMALSRKNRNLLWYNGTPMSINGSMYDTAILLQQGDTISIGRCAEKPWMEFSVKRIPNAVTPESEMTSRKRARQETANRRKSHRKLNYSLKESVDTKESSEEQCFAETQRDGRNVVFTQRISARDSNLTEESDGVDMEPRKWPKKVMMSPRRLIQPQGECIAAKTLTTEKNEVLRKECSQRINPSGESTESSVLSLPQCPTWDDDEEEDETSNVTQINVAMQGFNGEAVQDFCYQDDAKARHCGAKEPVERSSEDSAEIVFASTLSLAQWKSLRQGASHKESCRVRHALASLVVAQRAGDSTWFPAILEGAIVEEVDLRHTGE